MMRLQFPAIFPLMAAGAFVGGSVFAQLDDDVSGRVQPFKQVSVSSPVLQEVIQEVAVEEGDTVEAGQVLVRLRAEKEALELRQAQKLVERRAFQAKGTQTLYKEKIASQEIALEKETDLELAKLQVELAAERLKEKTIRAPISGIVVKKYKEAGEAVDRVEKLLDIVNIDKVYIQFYLDPKIIFKIKPDAKVAVSFPLLGDAQFIASVAFIDPRVDKSNLLRVKLVLDNEDHRLRPGMKGQADFSKVELAARDE